MGVSVGDAVLKKFADCLRCGIGSKGLFGRLSGDNFITCMPSGTLDISEALSAVTQKISSVAHGSNLVVSAGLYPIVDRSIPIDSMFDRAALPLATVKGDYGHHYAYYNEEMRDTLIEEQKIVEIMDDALAAGEFEAYLQPIYQVETGTPVCAEALVRWNRPGYGLVSPSLFIPLFERNGFISQVDRCIWEQVCIMQKRRREAHAADLPISVNVSRRNLYDPHLFDDIMELTQRYDVPPSLLRLEVTESAYMDDPGQLIETVEKLQAQGFPVLMDDFGSGYSSFNSFKDLPVDILKMDMKFMKDFEHGGRVSIIVASIIEMARKLGIGVVAEGVETVEQYQFLREMGCDYIQGFYFARPMSYPEFSEYMDSHIR